MRLRVTLLGIGVAIAALLPLLSAAATSPSAAVAGANIAPNTPSDAKACILKLFQAQNQKNASAGKPAGATTDGLKDTCTSENVSVDASGKKTITQTGRVGNNDLTNGCTADSCSAPKCGIVTVTISLPGSPSQTKTISKCDPNFQKDLSSASGNTADAMKNFALQSLAQSAIQNANPGTATGADQLTQALTKFGVSADDAQKVVSDDAANGTSNSKDLLSAFISQDPNQISQAATTAGITLNQDTINNIASLTPSQQSSYVSSLYTPDQQNSANNIANSPSTFASADSTGAGPTTSNVASALAPMCDQLGGCGNVCSTSNTMVCKTNNPGALTWASWEAAYGGQPCGQANNTTCFPTMEQGIQAQARLLTTSNSYFASGNNTIWGEFCGSNYASGPGSNCAAYATFVSQQTGIPINQTIDPNNAQQIGAIMMAQSRMESGVGVIFTPDQLQTGLGMAYGTQTLPGGTPGFTPNTIDTGVAGLGGTFTGGGNTPGQIITSSPFANLSNLYSTPGAGSYQNASYSQPTQYSQPSQNGQSTQTSSNTYGGTTQTNSTTGSQTAQTASTGQTGTAVAQIIAQPQTVALNGTITVSWSSVGMSSASPCQVMENGTTAVATANEGSKTVSASSAGTLTFSLSCTAQGTSAIVQSSASVVVQ